MGKVLATYYLIRNVEERFGSPLVVGDVLVARESSRLPWIHEIFPVNPGDQFSITEIEYTEASEPDYDPWDGHYRYHLKGLEEHGGISTTEIASLFDLVDEPDYFANVTNQIVDLLQDASI